MDRPRRVRVAAVAHPRVGVAPAIALLLATATAAAAFESYVIADLGTLGGSGSTAYGINASGQVVGLANVNNDGGVHAFLHDATGMHDLGTLGRRHRYAYA